MCTRASRHWCCENLAWARRPALPSTNKCPVVILTRLVSSPRSWRSKNTFTRLLQGMARATEAVAQVGDRPVITFGRSDQVGQSSDSRGGAAEVNV